MGDFDGDGGLLIMMILVAVRGIGRLRLMTMVCDVIVVITHIIHQIIITQHISEQVTYIIPSVAAEPAVAAPAPRASPSSSLATARRPLWTTTERCR